LGETHHGRLGREKIMREIMVFLHSHGVGTARAVRIFKTYGADAVQVMTENPYRLARDIRGIGFKTGDAITPKPGVEKTAMIRLRTRWRTKGCVRVRSPITPSEQFANMFACSPDPSRVDSVTMCGWAQSPLCCP
jgi:Helix-hairpin-helix containing domain